MQEQKTNSFFVKKLYLKIHKNKIVFRLVNSLLHNWLFYFDQLEINHVESSWKLRKKSLSHLISYLVNNLPLLIRNGIGNQTVSNWIGIGGRVCFYRSSYWTRSTRRISHRCSEKKGTDLERNDKNVVIWRKFFRGISSMICMSCKGMIVENCNQIPTYLLLYIQGHRKVWESQGGVSSNVSPPKVI